jgi:hypothetical protein
MRPRSAACSCGQEMHTCMSVKASKEQAKVLICSLPSNPNSTLFCTSSTIKTGKAYLHVCEVAGRFDGAAEERAEVLEGLRTRVQAQLRRRPQQPLHAVGHRRVPVAACAHATRQHVSAHARMPRLCCSLLLRFRSICPRYARRHVSAHARLIGKKGKIKC